MLFVCLMFIYSFVCGVLNDAVSSSTMSWTECGRKRQCLTEGTVPQLYLGTEEYHKKLSQASRHSGRQLKQEPPEKVRPMIHKKLRLSVNILCIFSRLSLHTTPQFTLYPLSLSSSGPKSVQAVVTLP